MPTSLDEERAKQQRWRLRAQWASVPWFDTLLANEFLPPEVQEARQTQALVGMVRFAARQVPYYRELFNRLGLTPEDIHAPGDLARLPRLTRPDVQKHAAALEPDRLPPGERRRGQTKTSGTTGQPVVVAQSQRGRTMFGLLKQRELRWADCNPLGKSGIIYHPTDLPPRPDGKLIAPGEMCRAPVWPMIGKYFETGCFVGLSNESSLEQQVAWLEEERPNNLLAMPSGLEHLALAFQTRPRLESLRGLRAVAQQLTPAMRRTISTVFGLPVEHNYGLNEIGLVASQCQEGGRFHVHAEHCLVEIVDDARQPAAPGKFGRMLITGLSNAAMPLIRYDPDDLAMALSGPCPCGRTLPSFGAIQGRYRRVAWLAPGVWEHWGAVQLCLEVMPDELLQPLRQYQMHHHADGRFVLRLVTAQPLAEEFFTLIRQAWQQADRDTPFPLEILYVDRMPPQPGVKFQDFTSDCVPPPDWEPPHGAVPSAEPRRAA